MNYNESMEKCQNIILNFALGDRLNLFVEIPVWRFDGKWAGNREEVMWYGLGTALWRYPVRK